MKRSEMLDIIWYSINELEDANHILKAIEKAGMLPPLKEFDVTRASSGEYIGRQLTFMWEPEND